MFDEFQRIKRLPPYVFNIVNDLKAKARARGEDIVDFGMGNPDQPTPDHIVDKLVEVGGLLARGKIKHSYPHSWRSKAPVIYRNTPQWFAAIDKPVGDGLLQVRDLRVHFRMTRGVIFRRTIGVVRAVDGLDFEIARGETPTDEEREIIRQSSGNQNL